jgi:hypothetical protein
MTEHKIDGPLKVERNDDGKPLGITVRCACGWVSAGHFTSSAASVALMNHKEKEHADQRL